MIVAGKIRRRSLVLLLAMMTVGQLSFADQKKEKGFGAYFVYVSAE